LHKKISFYLITSIIAAFLFNSCEKTDNSVIDPVLTFPAIQSVTLSTYIVDESNINITATANVSSEEQIKNVTVKVKNPLNEQVGIFTLIDDGVSPDLTAGDGIYTGTISFNMPCRIVGSYGCEFVAENMSGLFSNSITTNFTVVNTHNQLPSVSNIIIPDSLQKPSSGLNVAFLQARASDPDGDCDIKQVMFKSQKPDGSYSNGGNPFFMYDDGDIPNHGDTVAADMKYSLLIAIDQNAQTGYYKFSFNAKDRSDSLSPTIIDSIKVYE
jgi:hypothetical protein